MHFDPDELDTMGRAYDAAMHTLGNPGREIPASVREAVARRIIEVAGAGVLDVRELERLGLEASAITTPAGGLPCAPVSWGRDRGRYSPARLQLPVRRWPLSRRWRA